MMRKFVLYKHIALFAVYLVSLSNTNAVTLTPNYDDPREKLKFFDSSSSEPLILHCDISPPGDYKLKWEKNDEDVTSGKFVAPSYEINDTEHTLIVRETCAPCVGNYTCSIPELNVSAKIRVIQNVIFRETETFVEIDDGDSLKLECVAGGTEPKIRWTIGDEDDFDRDHVIISDTILQNDGLLTIKMTTVADTNIYKCIATNQATGFGDFKPAVKTFQVIVVPRSVPFKMIRAIKNAYEFVLELAGSIYIGIIVVLNGGSLDHHPKD